MKLNKKVIESMTVTSAMLVMTTITALGGSTEDGTGDKTESVALNKNGKAGIICELQNLEAKIFETGNLQVASIEKTQKDIVGKSGQGVLDDESLPGGTAGFQDFAAEAALQSIQEDAEA